MNHHLIPHCYNRMSLGWRDQHSCQLQHHYRCCRNRLIRHCIDQRDHCHSYRFVQVGQSYLDIHRVKNSLGFGNLQLEQSLGCCFYLGLRNLQGCCSLLGDRSQRLVHRSY